MDINACNTFQIIVVANGKSAVGSSVDIGFNAVIGTVARRNESRVRIFRLNAGKTSVCNYFCGYVFKFDRVHKIPTFSKIYFYVS